MAYPKRLSQKSIDKMFSEWNPRTVETLHRYFKAFSDLYGCIQLKNAWEVFRQFEPKIHKKEFMEFASVVRREDVDYYIFEVDELFTDEKRADAERFIVNKFLIGKGYGKFHRFYRVFEYQENKPYYKKSDLLKVAECPLNDVKLKRFVENMRFTDGENKGKKLSEVRTQNPKSDDITLSEEFMRRIFNAVNFYTSPVNYALEFFNEIDFVFKNQAQAEQLAKLIMEYINTSHFWINCGHSPQEIHAMSNNKPKTIILGAGAKKAFLSDAAAKEEFIRKCRELGIDVEE